jgi:hypothetical protein
MEEQPVATVAAVRVFLNKQLWQFCIVALAKAERHIPL